MQIAFLHGPKVELDLRPLMTKRLTHTGSTLRPRRVPEKAAIADALKRKVWPLLEAGLCKPVIDSVFPLEDVAKAHARMESSAAHRQDRAQDVTWPPVAGGADPGNAGPE